MLPFRILLFPLLAASLALPAEAHLIDLVFDQGHAGGTVANGDVCGQEGPTYDPCYLLQATAVFRIDTSLAPPDSDPDPAHGLYEIQQIGPDFMTGGFTINANVFTSISDAPQNRRQRVELWDDSGLGGLADRIYVSIAGSAPDGRMYSVEVDGFLPMSAFDGDALEEMGSFRFRGLEMPGADVGMQRGAFDVSSSATFGVRGEFGMLLVEAKVVPEPRSYLLAVGAFLGVILVRRPRPGSGARR